MKTKYLFTDIDSTIFEHYQIPKATISALQAAKANGHKIYICTGRPIHNIPPEVNNIIVYDGRICSSGSYIELDGKIYLDYFFPDELQEEVVGIFQRYPVIYTLETNSTVFFNVLNEELISTFPDDFVSDPPKYGLHYYGSPWPETNKMCIFSNVGPEPLQEISKILPDEYLFITAEMPVKDGWWYSEISYRNVSKGSAINYLVNNHDIPFEDTIAIGDSMNDYEMVKFAKTGIAMGNGDERLKAIADYVTADFFDDGYAKALKHCGLI